MELRRKMVDSVGNFLLILLKFRIFINFIKIENNKLIN
jgi:hypothetical protein